MLSLLQTDNMRTILAFIQSLNGSEAKQEAEQVPSKKRPRSHQNTQTVARASKRAKTPDHMLSSPLPYPPYDPVGYHNENGLFVVQQPRHVLARMGYGVGQQCHGGTWGYYDQTGLFIGQHM